jgi:hypothetical protein
LSQEAAGAAGGEGRDVGASRRAVRLARHIDRLCRVPGRYVIVVDVPAHRRAPWAIEIARQEVIGRLEEGNG